MQTKKMAVAALGAVMAFGSVASADWNFAGYDTRDLSDITKVYNEVINGKYTSKTKAEALPLKDIEWRAEGFELAYPHAGYDRLYLEDNAQKITRYNNLFPQWETRFVDYFWELYHDYNPAVNGHLIYQRQQTNVPGYGWTWDYSDDKAVDATLFVPTTRVADVTAHYEQYGVGPFNFDGYVMTPAEHAMYNRFGVGDAWGVFDIVPGTKEIEEGTFFHWENLSALDADGQYVWSDEEIADYVGAVQSKFLTGPSLRGDDPTKDVAAEYLVHGEAWRWNNDTLRFGGGKVEWTGVMYEAEEPYNYYQYMIINGMIFDGHNDLPRIYRYTGGKATPVVEWKYAFALEDPTHTVPDSVVKTDGVPTHLLGDDVHMHSIVEFKYLDGKLALDDEGNPIWRFKGEFENCYLVFTDTEIQVWMTGYDKPIQVFDRVTHDLGNYAGYMNSANWVSNF